MTRKGWILLVALPITILSGVVFTVFSLPRVEAPQTTDDRPQTTDPTVQPHIPMPAMVKGIYITATTVASKKRFGELLDFVDRTELNSVVIDVKIDGGALAYASDDPAVVIASSTAYLPPLEELTTELHRRGIYAIARIFVFQDPWYAERVPAVALKRADGRLWADRKGVTWTDPAAVEVWKYDVAIAREVWRRGFDEVQFDYIRFPTDGDVKNIVYPVWDGIEPMRSVMSRFFRYLDVELVAKGIPVSVDLFGYAVRLDDNELGIGQHASDALPFVTAISPMVYPSHYYAGSYGYDDPASRPGEIVAKSMEIARALMAASTTKATTRPWLQDFDIGAVYDAPKIRAQIRAAEEGGGSGWLFWNARNVYTEEAFAPEKGQDQVP